MGGGWPGLVGRITSKTGRYGGEDGGFAAKLGPAWALTTAMCVSDVWELFLGEMEKGGSVLALPEGGGSPMGSLASGVWQRACCQLAEDLESFIFTLKLGRTAPGG